VVKIRSGLLATAVALVMVGCGQPAASAPIRKAAQTPASTVPASSGALSLMHLRMVSGSTGWALAVPGDGRGLGHLVRTSDAGTHWAAIPLPSSLNTPNIQAVDFHDETHAWVLVVLGAESTASHEAAVVASTADGGAHWDTTPKFGIDGNGSGIQFIDAGHGWVFANPGAGGVIGAGDTTLYRTTDAGTHWQAIKPASEVRGNPTVVGGLPEACPMGGPIGQPTFADAQTGWLGAFCATPFVYVTHDGGRSWSPQNIPAYPGPMSAPNPYLLYNVDSLARLSATDVVFVLHRGVTTGANALQESAIYMTRDAGASWTAYRLPAAELGADFVDPMHGWMIGAGWGGDTSVRSLYSTVDGGRNWRLADGPADFFERDVSFGDRSSGLVTVPAMKLQLAELFRTTDAGSTWGRVATVIN
jgi:photosystem II stability/assembly factor-like uncharacterized protein